MPWFHGVAERYHDIQNPISADKIRLLGERIGLAPGQQVLDLACGRGGPAIVLALTFGCADNGRREVDQVRDDGA